MAYVSNVRIDIIHRILSQALLSAAILTAAADQGDGKCQGKKESHHMFFIESFSLSKPGDEVIDSGPGHYHGNFRRGMDLDDEAAGLLDGAVD